jgi:hypothetical protein
MHVPEESNIARELLGDNLPLTPECDRVFVLNDQPGVTRASNLRVMRLKAMEYTAQMFSGPVPPMDGILKVAEEIYQFLTRED